MSNHPYNSHREQQVAHRRVDTILNGSPSGAKKHAEGPAFSKITSKSAACRDDDVRGHSSAKRFARGGKVKGDTNINIVIPGGGAKSPMPMPMPMGGPPPGPGPGLPAPPMGGPPPGPPGMPMRASGGKVNGIATKEGIAKQSARAAANSYARGGSTKMTAGSESGVGRLQLAAIQKKR